MHSVSRKQVRRRATGERRVRWATVCAATAGALLTTGFGLQFAQIEAAADVGTAGAQGVAANLSGVEVAPVAASTDSGPADPAAGPTVAEQLAASTGSVSTGATPSSTPASAPTTARDVDEESAADAAQDELAPPADPPKKASKGKDADASSGAS